MALHEFEKSNGRLPGSHCDEDAAQLLLLAKQFNAKHKTVEEINEGLLKALANTSIACISPMVRVVPSSGRCPCFLLTRAGVLRGRSCGPGSVEGMHG